MSIRRADDSGKHLANSVCHVWYLVQWNDVYRDVGALCGGVQCGQEFSHPNSIGNRERMQHVRQRMRLVRAAPCHIRQTSTSRRTEVAILRAVVGAAPSMQLSAVPGWQLVLPSRSVISIKVFGLGRNSNAYNCRKCGQPVPVAADDRVSVGRVKTSRSLYHMWPLQQPTTCGRVKRPLEMQC